MSLTLATSSTHGARLSDIHKHRLELFVDIPPSPIHSARMSTKNTPRDTETTESMSTTSKLISSKPTPGPLKRKLDVFVEIPPSPLHRTTPISSSKRAVSNSSSLRRRSQVYVEIPASPINASLMKGTLKSGMKPSPLSTKAFNLNTSTGSPNKKTKLSEQFKIAKQEHQASGVEDFPNGHFYCHQCRKKLDNSLGLHCTVVNKNPCKSKYCKHCLKNRYGEDADMVKRRAFVAYGKHATGESYQWICPKCTGHCNCYACRKAKGLPPLGKLPQPVVRPGFPSMTDIFKFGGTSPEVIPYCHDKMAQSEQQPKPRGSRAKKPVREPKWIAVSTNLTRSQVEDRFFLREFILRFSPLMSRIGVTYLEDLDLFHTLSRQAAKAFVYGVLDLIAADAEAEEAKVIREALKKIGGAGADPAALWARLELLCDSLPNDFFVVPIPDPAARPSYAEDESDDEHESVAQRLNSRIKTLRSAKNSPVEEEVPNLDNGVTHPLQLLPCIIALCECALQGPSVRAEIEEGAADSRGENRSCFAEVRKENERWAKERASLGWAEEKTEVDAKPTEKKGKLEKDSEKDKAYRAALTKHKNKLSSLENAHLLELQGAAPRFGPLGADSQGRIYYAASAFRRREKRAKAKVPDEDDRTGLLKWGWFLAVWGRGSSVGDDKEERWWGFSDPVEIRQLAKWLAAAEGVDGKDSIVEGPGGIHVKGGEDWKRNVSKKSNDAFAVRPSTDAQVKALVKDLNEYADLLEWRLSDGEVRS